MRTSRTVVAHVENNFAIADRAEYIKITSTNGKCSSTNQVMYI